MKTRRILNACGCVVIALLLCPDRAPAGGSQVPVGTYLYANPEKPERFEGGLTVKFASPGERMVVAYGRKYRKDRKTREETIEQEREMFKPYLGKMEEKGTRAVFPHLPPDFYDLVVIEAGKTMKLYEGLSLLQDSKPELITPSTWPRSRRAWM